MLILYYIILITFYNILILQQLQL